MDIEQYAIQTNRLSTRDIQKSQGGEDGCPPQYASRKNIMDHPESNHLINSKHQRDRRVTHTIAKGTVTTARNVLAITEKATFSG